MKKTSAKITRFESGNWIVDIVETRTQFESWLAPKDGGAMEFMFGSPKTQQDQSGAKHTQTFDDFCETVEANLPEYKAIYNLEHT